MSGWKVNCGFKVNKMKQYSHRDHTERRCKQQDGNHGLSFRQSLKILALTELLGHTFLYDFTIIRSSCGESCVSGRTDSQKYEA